VLLTSSIRVVGPAASCVSGGSTDAAWPKAATSWLRLLAVNEDAKLEATSGARGALAVDTAVAAVICGMATPGGPFGTRFAAAYAAASLTSRARWGCGVLISAGVAAGNRLTTTSVGVASVVVQP